MEAIIPVRARLAFVGLSFVATLTFACTAGSQLSGGHASKAKDDGDGRRPSEQGEGLVGYLRDPDDVHFVNANGRVGATAEAKAVVTDDGSSPEGLDVCLQLVTTSALKSIVGSGAAFGGDGVRTLASSTVEADGSFRVSADADGALAADAVLAINVAGKCAHAGSTPLEPAAARIAFKPANAKGFKTAAAQFPEYLDGEVETPSDDAPATPDAQICGPNDPGVCDSRFVVELYETDGTRIPGAFAIDITAQDGAPKPVTSGFKDVPQSVDLYVNGGHEYLIDVSAPGYQRAQVRLDASGIASRAVPAPITKLRLSK
jgi:hypothetical protein